MFLNEPLEVNPAPLFEQAPWVTRRWLILASLAFVVGCLSYFAIDLPLAKFIDANAPNWLRATANFITEAGDSAIYFFYLPLAVGGAWVIGRRVTQAHLAITTAGVVAAVALAWILPYNPKNYTVGDQIIDIARIAAWAIAAGSLIAWAFDRMRAIREGALLLAAIALAGIAVNLLKFCFGRSRPTMYFRWVEGRKNVEEVDAWGFQFFQAGYGFASFPSGHSTTVGAVAAILWLRFPRYRPAWVALAATVAMTRVINTAHYLSDTLIGLTLGVTVAAAAHHYLMPLLERWLGAGLAPDVHLTAACPGCGEVIDPPRTGNCPRCNRPNRVDQLVMVHDDDNVDDAHVAQ